jgi:hypothetical protein
MGNGALSVPFATPVFTDVFIPIAIGLGAKAVIVLFVLVRRTRRQRKTHSRTSKKHGRNQAEGAVRCLIGRSVPQIRRMRLMGHGHMITCRALPTMLSCPGKALIHPYFSRFYEALSPFLPSRHGRWRLSSSLLEGRSLVPGYSFLFWRGHRRINFPVV